MASVKGFFRGLWHGVKVVAPFAEMASTLTGNPIPGIISAFVVQAEDAIAGQGKGSEKAQFVTKEALAMIEKLTGKDMDSPEAQALIGKVIAAEVSIRNAIAAHQDALDALQAYIEAAKRDAA